MIERKQVRAAAGKFRGSSSAGIVSRCVHTTYPGNSRSPRGDAERDRESESSLARAPSYYSIIALFRRQTSLPRCVALCVSRCAPPAVYAAWAAAESRKSSGARGAGERSVMQDEPMKLVCLPIDPAVPAEPGVSCAPPVIGGAVVAGRAGRKLRAGLADVYRKIESPSPPRYISPGRASPAPALFLAELPAPAR